MNASPTEGHAPVRSGKIAFALHGRADNPQRIVLVHSLAMDRRFWAPVAERLSSAAAVMLYDCRDHGQSSRSASDVTAADHANDLADLLAHVGWDSALVGGASMGGCIALQFAGSYPARTQALALVDTTAWYGEKAVAEWEERAQRAIQAGFESMMAFQATRWFSDAFRAAHPEVVQQCADVFVRNDPQAYARTCRMLGAFDGRALLPTLAMPAAVVVGEEDFATPRPMAEALHAGIRGSTFTVLPGVRHLTPIECPERIANELQALLERSAHKMESP